MVDVPASCHLRAGHVLVANAADIIVLLQLVACRILQAVDLRHCRPSLAERAPAVLGLTPDVEVGVDEHHAGSDGAAALKKQDPASVEEKEDSEAELDSVPRAPDVVHPVIQTDIVQI